MDSQLSLGFHHDKTPAEYQHQRTELLKYVNLKLSAKGLPVAPAAGGMELVDLAEGLLANHREKTRRLETGHRCPVDERIENFLDRYFCDLSLEQPLRLPSPTFILDRHGIARELSLPANGDHFSSDIVKSYRVRNGVLHNPKADRRTTQGTFHVVEGGLPIPGDKRVVRRDVFVKLFRYACQAPPHLTLLPFTSEQEKQGHTWVSLLLRPMVCPEVRGYTSKKTMETRFFAPGTLVSNLDFVESIFGNAGDPFIPANDAALDVEHWSGHTGCVILAPHLLELTKKELGLPHVSEATEREIQDHMCWKSPEEIYNDGKAFKLTCRDASGVIVTLIADNYFGYCKKEVKTQLSYAANLLGGVEEEHSGGALVFPSWNLGDEFQFNSRRYNGLTLQDVLEMYSDRIDYDEVGGFGVDKQYPNLLYIPENAKADLREQNIRWERDGQEYDIPLLPGQVYMAPSGYRVRMEKHPHAPTWRLIGTAGEGTFCHKPCTVSGGGKSEISKSLVDYMQYGSVFVSDIEQDFKKVREIFEQDYSKRWTPEALAKQNYEKYPSRDVLDIKRSLGSVIKLLTPSDEYNEEYNAWLKEIPNHVYALVFLIKRFYRPEWGDRWDEYFGVDFVNGQTGHELKLGERKLVGSYLRVGYGRQKQWRMFKLRQDFIAAFKVQTEDDITASVVVPEKYVQHVPDYYQAFAYKFAENCEYRLFQRPDDAIHRGFDKQAEADLAQFDINFVSNFEPTTREQVLEMMEKVVDFDAFTLPMQRLLRSVVDGDSGYIVCSDNPRKIDDVPTKNPRYLQDRPDLVRPEDRYMSEMGTRLFRRIPSDEPVPLFVNAILSGRRNNPPEPSKNIRSLAVYNPIHYQQLPELFMDYICSLTGKSPSTTGAGSEGALTKSPFNALRPITDLNNALVSMILTGLPGFSTPAGHVGPDAQFDHDISLLIPEIWCRLSPAERDPDFLIANKLLEPVSDMEFQGQTVAARRLGYRITRKFVRTYFGRVFDNPATVFNEKILRPETQDEEAFFKGVQQIMEAYERVAKVYFADGSIEDAVPPLKALLHIMAEGQFEGEDERSPALRSLFTRESLLASDWYKARLETKQQQDIALWKRHVHAVSDYLETQQDLDPDFAETLRQEQQLAKLTLERVSRPDYLDELVGTLGTDPSLYK